MEIPFFKKRRVAPSYTGLKKGVRNTMPAPRSIDPRPKQLTPLWVISLFVSLTETTLGIAATKTTGGVQIALTAFVIGFPVLVAAGFFAVLWQKAYVFYPPSEYALVDVQRYVEAFKGPPGPIVTKTVEVQEKIQLFGNPDRFRLLFKASGETWVRSTKAMEVPEGCLVQVSTRFMTPQGEWNRGGS